MADSPFIFEANESNFEQVMQHSHRVLVLVDFWAEWCQPCKTLMPILSKIVNDLQGQVIMVKVNSDQNQNLAAQFGVRSIPTVKFIKGGKVVDEFMGVQPAEKIQQMIKKHRIRPTEPYRQQALALYQAGEVDNALNLLQQVLQHEPDFAEAKADLATMLLAQEQIEAAEVLVSEIPEGEIPADQLNQLKADIRLAKLQQAAGNLDTSALEARIQANAQDWDAYLELAQVLIAHGEYEQGLENYLIVMRKNPTYNEGAGRKGLLSTLELLGPKNPLVKKYRSKMFSLLY